VGDRNEILDSCAESGSARLPKSSAVSAVVPKPSFISLLLSIDSDFPDAVCRASLFCDYFLSGKLTQGNSPRLENNSCAAAAEPPRAAPLPRLHGIGTCSAIKASSAPLASSVAMAASISSRVNVSSAMKATPKPIGGTVKGGAKTEVTPMASG